MSKRTDSSERVAAMKAFDESKKRGRYIAGVDEAGRGPLAGPVFAAAVILPDDAVIDGINDSKKLTEKKRNELYDIIRKQAVAYSICAVSEQRIDQINILRATMSAMKKAVSDLKVRPAYVLVDGNRMPDLDVDGECVIKGDALSMSVAAASILAKVSRDRYMIKMAQEYPGYDFEKHKGYGTRAHYDAIDRLGISPIHRRTFLKKYEQERNR